MGLIKALLARCVAAVLFETQCLRFGVPGLSWRIRRARIAAFKRQMLCDPGNREAAALAGVAGGEQVFIAELAAAIARYQAKRAPNECKPSATGAESPPALGKHGNLCQRAGRAFQKKAAGESKGRKPTARTRV